MTDKTKRDDATLRRAMKIMEERLTTYAQEGPTFTSPELVKNYCVIKIGHQQREVFACLFMDNRNRLIEYRELFYGTIDGASVHPREVVKAALACNSAAVIFTHNHPSGIPEPSRADEQITQRLKQALDLIDIRALDHIVVGGLDTVSFAERGLL